ncbi:acyl-CoA synthetase [Comamonadaceae bacterium]
MATGEALLWWREPAVVRRFVADLLQSEMALLRPSGWAWPAATQGDVHLVRDLQADSLEMMSLFAAFADALPAQTPDMVDTLHEHTTWHGWAQVLASAMEAAYAHSGARMPMRFRTSGSTGTPKSCVHAFGDLVQEMQAMAAVLVTLQMPIQRVVSAVRSHHIYGFLFTVLLPRIVREQPMPVVNLQGRAPLGLDRSLQPEDLVVAFPDWWRAALRSSVRFPDGVVGVSSTAPCPEDVAQAALAAGLQEFLQIYGSSETAGIGWRATGAGMAAFQLHGFWQRVADAPHHLQRTHADGSTTLVALQDALIWRADGCFVPGPRLDATVQVGGVNVDLAQLQTKLQAHPAVQAVALRLHPFAGTPRIKAFVVPAAPALADAALREALAVWCRQHLAPAARPVHWAFGPALPVNGQGKPTDWPVDLDAA